MCTTERGRLSIRGSIATAPSSCTDGATLVRAGRPRGRLGSVLHGLGDRDAAGDPLPLVLVEVASGLLCVLHRPVRVQHHPDDDPVAGPVLVETGRVHQSVEATSYAGPDVAGVLVEPVPQHRRGLVV